MCNLLVCVHSEANPDPYLDAKRPKPGDVIVVMPDDHEWGRAELTNPDWKIVRIPGVQVVDAMAFVQPEIDEDPANPSRMLQYRAFSFDLNAEPKNLEELMAAKARKPRLSDPNVL